MEDSSSVNLLSVKNHTSENNNMVETQTFELYDCEKTLKAEKSHLRKTKRTQVVFVVAWTFIICAILFLIGAIVFFVKFSGTEGEVSFHNQTSKTSQTTILSTSSSILVTSTSTDVSTSSVSNVTTQSSSINSTVSVSSTSAGAVDSSTPSSTVISTRKPSTNTTTVTIATTTVTVCATDEFRCSDGTCIEGNYVCDGKPHCPLADDEYRNCQCSDSKFRCHSGQCIEANFRCDGVPQCYDKSDEMNCSNCSGFQCDSGQCLWINSVKCNDIVDCLDLSDETNCGWRRGYGKCKNGLWIHRSKFCDGIDDCFDNSDEKECDTICNPLAEKLCSDFRTCIMVEWSCDGYTDCPDGSDEKNCGTCSSEQFQCADYSCIPTQQVCDGIKQCPSGTDEVDCLQLTNNGATSEMSGIVMGKSHDQFLPICSSFWSSDAAVDVCRYFGHGNNPSSMHIPLATAGVSPEHGFMVLQNSNGNLRSNQTILSRFANMPTCPAAKVVWISCETNDCGERKVDIMTPFIVGGTISQKGKWPWIVSISMLGQGVCGGTVVSPRWILAAAHCVVTALANYTLTPHYYEVTAGTNNRQRTINDNAQRRNVDKIILHPQMKRFETGITDWDLALFHLDAPLVYGDYLQPVCMPSQGEHFPTNSQCYLAGWGYINTQEVTVNSLREGKMRLWSEQDCADNGIDTSINTNSTICAGYHSGGISACKGDSGSPLMCTNTRGHWTVVGVMSHGINGCNGGTSRRANRYAKVSSAVDWIDKFTEN